MNFHHHPSCNHNILWSAFFLSLFFATAGAGLSACDTKQLREIRVDSDGDGAADIDDQWPDDPTRCYDLDGDGCDDCTNGSVDSINDGPNLDGDQICDMSDNDADGDGRTNDVDPNDMQPGVCGTFEDDCDDCGRHPGSPTPSDDGPDFDANGICNVSDPSTTPQFSACLSVKTIDQAIAPYSYTTTLADTRHIDTELTSQEVINGFNEDCSDQEGQLVNDELALLDGGCNDHGRSQWRIDSLFVVVAFDGTALDIQGYNHVIPCDPPVTIGDFPDAECLDNPTGGHAGCKLSNNASNSSVAYSLDAVNYTGAPDASHPLKIYPFVTKITFSANDYFESQAKDTAKLLVQYKAPDGSLHTLWNKVVYDSQDAANNNPYVIFAPGGGFFTSGLGSLVFTRQGGPITVRNVVIEGRKNY